MMLCGTLVLAALLPLTACSQSGSSSADTHSTASAASAADEPSVSFIGAEVKKSMEQAKQELLTENIGINHVAIHTNDDDHDSDDRRPKAEITPKGELLIAGKAVPATPAQQELLMNYRQQIIGIAEAGMDIGSRGADLGISAAKQAVWGALSGKNDKDIDAAIKPQADKIEAAAIQLCSHMPALLATQQQLASAMPAFKPYATMQQKDVDDCGKDKNGKKGIAVFSD